MTAGRPLRFLAASLGGWVLIRIALLLPEFASLPASELVPRVIDVLVPDVAAAGLVRRHPRAPVAGRPQFVASPPDTPHSPAPPPIPATVPAQQPVVVADDRDPQRSTGSWSAVIPSPVAPPAVAKGPAFAKGARRLSGSVWLLARGGPAGTVSGGQLGASQGGVRLAYALGNARRVAVVGRIAAPLAGAGREAALGLEWQPTRWPIRIVAEQRFALDSGRGGPTLGVIAGYGPTDIVSGVRLEAYGQAGGIVRDGVEGFVDASARITHPLGDVRGIRVDVGVGAWGSAQRAAERFDIGPSFVVAVPVARKTIRLTLDWRQRIAGGARPGSGPALSLGSDV